MKKLNFKGFTLVEVLIVIIIVGILIAALIPRLGGGQARARDLSRQQAVNQIASTIELLITERGALTTTGTLCVNTLTGVAANGVDLGAYLSEMPSNAGTVTTAQFGDGVAAGLASDCTNSFVVHTNDDGTQAIVLVDAESESAGTIAASGTLAAYDPDAVSAQNNPGSDLIATRVVGAVGGSR